MGTFRKKPVIVQAHRWFKNGDHPEDNSHPLIDDMTGERYLSEGKVVRYYRHPSLRAGYICAKCDQSMHHHGWIDTLEGGHVVCPGDWIITGVQKEKYPCKPDIFEATYEPVPETPSEEGG